MKTSALDTCGSYRPLNLQQRARQCGHWSAARYAYLRGIPFFVAYLGIFGRLPRK